MMSGALGILGTTFTGIQAIGGVVQAVSQAKPVFWDTPTKNTNSSDNEEDIHDTLDDVQPVAKKRAPNIGKFDTLQKPLEQILDWLKNKKGIDKIGIRGTVGIGKRSILQNLNNHEEVANMFDIVIWLTASQEGISENLRRELLLKDMAERLKLRRRSIKDHSGDCDQIAKRISMLLKHKKFLLLLGDVKKDLNLLDIGIPTLENGSKIVLTSKVGSVCASMVHRVINVKNLSDNEAWEMFQDVLENPKLIKDPKIGPLAWQVCMECGGLPLLIEKVANTFKLKNSERLWTHGLNSWRMWLGGEQEGIQEIYELLKFCYNDLPYDSYKRCFVYGALYPEGSEIYADYLLECWAAEDFPDSGYSMKKHNMNWDEILLHLKNVSLLEEGKDQNHVIMHKFIRQVALYISEDHTEYKYLVEASKDLIDPPDVKLWMEKNQISLGDNLLSQLPDSPSCEDLSTLFLQKNLGLKEIPALFFNNMRNLRILDLSYTRINSLPESILCLIGLKILYLNSCRHLEELPQVVQLENLEALDIQGSGVNNIPADIEKLIKLKRLRISFCKFKNGNTGKEVIFDYDKISKLSSLEELIIEVKSLNQWSSKVEEKIIKEVAKLKKFKVLRVVFPDKVEDVIEITPMVIRIRVHEAAHLQNFMANYSRRRDLSFQFFISCQDSPNPEIQDFVKCKKYIKYCNGRGSNFPDVNILAESDAFELVEHKDITQLFEIESMNKVRHCLIQSCDAMETILGCAAGIVLPVLEHLHLKSLKKLKEIWKDQLHPGSLIKLKTLVLTDCEGIEEIIKGSNTAGNLQVFPELEELILVDMKELKSICRNEMLNWPSLIKLSILKCPKLCKLPFNNSNAKKLNLIEAEKDWWNNVQFRSELGKKQLEKFCTFR